MKKRLCTLFMLLLMTAFLPYPALCDDRDKEAAAESKDSEGRLSGLIDRISIRGLIEFGGGYKSTDLIGGGTDTLADIHLTTVSFGVGVEIVDWVNLDTVFLYEDPFGLTEDDLFVETATVTFGNIDKHPLYGSAGKMYLPFGALLTHLPDCPAVDQPNTLLLGEILEKAVLIGYEKSGLSFSGYVFKGDLNVVDHPNKLSFGFDGHYSTPEDSPVEMFVGASYISNISDSEGLTVCLLLFPDRTELMDHVGGIGSYMHLGFHNFFFDAEFISALKPFDPEEIPLETGGGAQPIVWNFETGYNWNWGRNLEAVFKYAGSNETEALGFPEARYGFGLNQTIVKGVVGSFAFLRDRHHAGDALGGDKGFTVLGQISIKF